MNITIRLIENVRLLRNENAWSYFNTEQDHVIQSVKGFGE